MASLANVLVRVSGITDARAALTSLWSEIDAEKGRDVTILGNENLDRLVSCTQTDVHAFLAWFIPTVSAQGARKVDRTTERVNALRLIQDFNSNPTPRAFTAVDPHKFAFQLALRVREPRLINQGEVNLCGPNSLLIQFAKRSPMQYALLALDLYQKGKGYLDKLEIEPELKIRGGIAGDLPEADYVVLGSLRNSGAILYDPGLVRGIGLLTKPGVLCRWLTEAGYTNVQDHTFFDLPFYAMPIALVTKGSVHGSRDASFREGEDNLRLAAQKLGGGHQVVMNAEADLSGELIGNDVTPRSGGGRSNAMETHWTWIRKLTLSPSGATPRKITLIKFYTWGQSYTRANIDMDDFLTRYAGFVSYKD
jgi:hypothetical protein